MPTSIKTSISVLVGLGFAAVLAAHGFYWGSNFTSGAKVGSKARQFNGTSDFLSSASALNYASTNIISVSLFVYWNAFANNDALVGESSANYNSNAGTFLLDWNASGTGMLEFDVALGVGSNYMDCRITRPSAAVWHHYLFVGNVSSTTNTCKAYVDGTSSSPTVNNSGVTGTLSNQTLYLFSRAGTSLFGAGRLSELAIWKADESANVAALAAYTAASSIDATNLLYYWPIKQVSPETPTTGAINLTVTGTTSVAGPNP